MLAKKQRLKLRDRVLQKQLFKSSETPFFRFYTLKTTSNQLAVVVPKKVATKSFQRHLLKRRIKDIIQQQFDENKPLGILVTVKKAATPLTYQELKKNIISQLNKSILK